MSSLKRTISIPESLSAIADQLEKAGHYASFSDLLQDLIRIEARRRGLIDGAPVVADAQPKQETPESLPEGTITRYSSIKRHKKVA